MKLSVDQIHERYPDQQIKKAFFDRVDIRNLPPDEQEKRWELHKVALEDFIKFLSTLDVYEPHELNSELEILMAKHGITQHEK